MFCFMGDMGETGRQRTVPCLLEIIFVDVESRRQGTIQGRQCIGVLNESNRTVPADSGCHCGAMGAVTGNCFSFAGDQKVLQLCRTFCLGLYQDVLKY